MGDDAFSTRLRWSASRGEGAAKLHGTRVLLSSPPVLEGCPDMAELDYVPEAGAFVYGIGLAAGAIWKATKPKPRMHF